jgi:putative membrane protein
MAGFLIRLAIGMFGLWVAQAVVPGMHIEGTSTLILAALLLGLVNAVVRPLRVILTLPDTLLTRGL